MCYTVGWNFEKMFLKRIDLFRVWTQKCKSKIDDCSTLHYIFALRVCDENHTDDLITKWVKSVHIIVW